MKIITRISFVLKEARLYIFPSVPGNEKSGADAPIASVGCSSVKCGNALRGSAACNAAVRIIKKIFFTTSIFSYSKDTNYTKDIFG